MRIKINSSDLKKLFSTISANGISKTQLAKSTGVSGRTINDWKNGKYTIPSTVFNRLIEYSGLEKSSINHEELSDWWYSSKAGLIGSNKRFELHGPLGTLNSRKLGGKRSYESRKNNTEDIFARKKITIPKQDEKLAEFIGIMIGDGSMNRYQISIALSSIVDIDYSKYVETLIQDLFGLYPKKTIKKTAIVL